MSTKALLNVTSHKKRNGMLTYSNTLNTGASQGLSMNTAYVNGAQATSFFVFIPTAMSLAAPNFGAINPIGFESRRTSTTCFMRGFSEHLRVQTSSALPWFHRRICFTVKGINAFTSLIGDSPLQNWRPYYDDTNNGSERTWFNETINTMPNTIALQQAMLFRGTTGVDWNDLVTAPVDTRRVDVKFDKTWVLKSSNGDGTLVERKLWHGMNKNVVYDDDESGSTETASYFSTSDKRGMGDYIIVDLFQPGVGSTASDILNVFSNSTLYWHEK